MPAAGSLTIERARRDPSPSLPAMRSTPISKRSALFTASAFLWAPITSMTASAQFESFARDDGTQAQVWAFSADGSVVTGAIYPEGFSGSLAFRFSDEGGFETLGTINGVTALAVDVSDDGSFIAGNVSNSRAVRWGADGVALDLGSLGLFDTAANAISGDGVTIVGRARISQFNPPYSHAFRWTEAAGMVDMHPSFGPTMLDSTATDVSPDGSVIVGWTTLPTSMGFDQRTAFRWTEAGGAVDIGSGVADSSQALAVSDDGSVVAGFGRFGSTALQIWVWTAGTGMVALGEYGGCQPPVLGVSADGSIVYGSCLSAGFLWTPALGRQDFTGANIFLPTDSTADGSLLVGVTLDGGALKGATWSLGSGVTQFPSPAGGAFLPRHTSSDGTIMAGATLLTGEAAGTRWRSDGSVGDQYCSPAVANSAHGTGAHLALSGTNISQFAALELAVTDLPPQTFGFFLTSTARDMVAMPGGSQGTLCLGGSIGRFVGPGQIQNSGAQGAFSLTVDPRTLPSPGGPVLPSFGETWNFQAWYRDANPGVTSNFSSAASVAVY